MAKLIIQGDIKQLNIIATTQRARAAKYGLKISLEDTKGGGNPPLSNERTKEAILEEVTNEPKKRGRKPKEE